MKILTPSDITLADLQRYTLRVHTTLDVRPSPPWGGHEVVRMGATDQELSMSLACALISADIAMLELEELDLVRQATYLLAPKLVPPRWRKPWVDSNLAGGKMTGASRIAAEALYFLLGGAGSGYVLKYVSFSFLTKAAWPRPTHHLHHYYLEGRANGVLDPTSGALKTPTGYATNWGHSFRSTPSRRAQAIIDHVNTHR